MITLIKSKVQNNQKLSLLVVTTFVLLSVALVGILTSNEKANAGYPDVVTESTDDPSEEPLDDYVWQGGPTDPKYIELASINAGGFIQKVGVDQRQEVGVPSNVGLAGWFIDMVKPGEKGLSIIDGHVDGRSKPGIFKQLDRLKNGDQFTVEFGNGSKKTFEVKGQTKVADSEAPAVLFSQDQGESQLNLITCGGTYDSNQRRYLDRIIIKSVPVQV